MCTRVQDFVQVAMGSFLEVCSGFCCNKLFEEFFLVVFFSRALVFFPWQLYYDLYEHCTKLCICSLGWFNEVLNKILFSLYFIFGILSRSEKLLHL